MQLSTVAEAEPGGGRDIVLAAVGLLKKFGFTRAVDYVSLEIPRGEVLCVIGPNGAGKTTLLLLLGGVILPSAGHVTVFGMHRWKDNFEIRKRSTFLTAEPIFGASPTPYEFLRFYGQIYELPKAVFLERVRRLAGEMDMIPHLKKPWTKLSLGMKKKTGLIASFLPDAELRFLDEPFAGGIDPKAMDRLYLWMQDAAERGETVVFSTQVLEQAESAADRILLMEKGAVTAMGTPAELIASAGIAPGAARPLYKAFLALTAVDEEP